MGNFGYPASERFSYDWVDVPMFGKLGGISEYNDVEIETDA